MVNGLREMNWINNKKAAAVITTTAFQNLAKISLFTITTFGTI